MGLSLQYLKNLNQLHYRKENNFEKIAFEYNNYFYSLID